MTRAEKKVLLLGGTGFAGGHMADLLAEEHRVFACGREVDVRNIDAIAAAQDAPVRQLDRDFYALSWQVEADARQVNTVCYGDTCRLLKTKLLGPHQARNAAVAWAAFKTLAENDTTLDEEAAACQRLVQDLVRFADLWRKEHAGKGIEKAWLVWEDRKRWPHETSLGKLYRLRTMISA